MKNQDCSDYASRVAQDIDNLLSSDEDLSSEISTVMSVLGGLDQYCDPRAVAIACMWHGSMVIEQDLELFCDDEDSSDRVVIQACDIIASGLGSGFDYNAVCCAISDYTNGDFYIDEGFVYSSETKEHKENWMGVLIKMKEIVSAAKEIHSSKQRDYRNFASNKKSPI